MVQQDAPITGRPVTLRTLRAEAFGRDFTRSSWRFAMRLSEQSSDPLLTVFGAEFVKEQHSDETHRNLPPAEKRKFVVYLSELIKALRAALWLR